MPKKERKQGQWMQTFTGRAFWPLDPCVSDIDPIDIAHSLSLICRYGGHTRRFYSVAEHCVLVSYAVTEAHALWALLHDATEAYVGDMIRPLKRQMPEYVKVENNLMLAICERFNLSPRFPEEVKIADTRILLDERAELLCLPPPRPWVQDEAGVFPLGVKIQAFSPSEAEAAFIFRLKELGSAE